MSLHKPKIPPTYYLLEKIHWNSNLNKLIAGGKTSVPSTLFSFPQNKFSLPGMSYEILWYPNNHRVIEIGCLTFRFWGDV